MILKDICRLISVFVVVVVYSSDMLLLSFGYNWLKINNNSKL